MTTLPADFDALFTHHKIVVNDIQLHYVMGGQGDPVVLLHGWPLTWYSWRKIMPALAQHYTVIAPDLRGLGDSETAQSGYDKVTVAEDIYQLVRALGHQKILLVGHDMGALVAYVYAARHRAEVEKLVILDVPILGYGLEEFAQAHRLWHFGFHETPGMPEALTTDREHVYLEHFYPSYNPSAMTPEDIDEYIRCYTRPGSMHAGFEYYRAFADDEKQIREFAKEPLPMPVLALGGEHAGGDSPASSLRQLARDVRGGVLPDSGHYLAEEQPEELSRRLLSFFAE